MPREVLKDGEWQPGKAAPEHLPEHLRELPSSFVTKEEPDPIRIHALDAPHIVEALTREQRLAEGSIVEPDITPPEPKAKKVTKEQSLFKAGTRLRLSSLGRNRRQREIDFIRFKVIHNTISDLSKRAAAGETITKDDFSKPRHIYFPEDNLMHFGCADGWAPVDKKRARYLKGIELNVDLLYWPQQVLDILKEQGVAVPTVEDLQNSIFNGSSQQEDSNGSGLLI